MARKQAKETIQEYHLNKNQPGAPQIILHDLGNYLQTHQTDTVIPHIHSFYQIIWFKNGNGIHLVDFKKHPVHNNSIFLVAKNQVHSFDGNLDYNGVLIHFNEAFLIHPENPTDFFLRGDLFNNSYQSPSISLNQNLTSILDNYVSQIQIELSSREMFGKEELLRASLKSFLIQLQRYRTNQDNPIKIGNPFVNEKRVQLIQFMNLVDENYSKGYSVGEYAKLLAISSRTLSDLCKQQIYKTPSQMIRERVVLEAQRLLIHSHLNINQLANRLGFDDPSYFVKYFKKHSGVSPMEFRKSIS